MGKEADGLGIGPLQVVLQVKIEIVTIDRNYQEAISFEQMKIAGKCPLIYILYKPGHYDIIYSIVQSKADGFDSINQKYTPQISLPYNYQIQNPDKPFFIEVTKNGQECPKEDFKIFQIMFDFPYKSTNGNSLIQQILKRCMICQQQILLGYFINLKCNHQFCKYCLEERIKLQSLGQIIKGQNEFYQRASCFSCNKELTQEEIIKITDKEKLDKAQRNNFNHS